MLDGGYVGIDAYGANQCTGDQTDVSPSIDTWSSLNPSIAKVTVQKAQGILPGTTFANGEGLFAIGNGAICTWQKLYPSARLAVQPTVTSISPPRGLIGNSISVTIDGAGFNASSLSVSAGSDITVTVNSHTDTQIQASFAIAPTASGGNHGVTVSAGGQTSPAANYVQVPHTMIRDTAYGNGGLGALVTITNGNDLDIFGNVIASGDCGVYRNIGYFLVDQEKPA